MPREHDPARAQRIEMILQQVESLPTLSPIATRLLQLSVDDDAEVKDIVSLVQADPALTSKLLSMCRHRDRAASQQVTTVERAVVLLGFDAVRTALLSVNVYELMGEAPGAQIDESPSDEPGLDRVELWRHLLATACAAEMLARDNSEQLGKHTADEAFVAGLLHDLGKIALDVILPQTYSKVARAVEQQRGNIAEIERRFIGVDHHRAGKRLAQHWCLPHSLQDVMWLHNQPAESLPDLPHKILISIVTVADAIVRKLHIGWSGNQLETKSLEHLAREHGLEPASVVRVEQNLHETVQQRAGELGLDDVVGSELQMRSIAAANRSLASMNGALQRQAQQCQDQAVVLRAINAFLEDASRGQSVISTLGDVVRSASGIFGKGFYCSLYQRREGSPWQVCQFSCDGKLRRSEFLEPPPGFERLEVLADFRELRTSSLALIPWLEDFLHDSCDIRKVRLLPLVCQGKAPVLLIHESSESELLMRHGALQALTGVWASAVAAAAQHEGANRMGEELAEANRVLSETQTHLAEAKSLVKLSQLAAGAAHEMNNPLTIISGRCQLLRKKLRDADTRTSVETIQDATCRLSELITALHVFASPPEPERRATDLADMLMRTVRDLKLERHNRNQPCPPVQVVFDDRVPPVRIDPEQVTAATKELLKNAMESGTRQIICVRVHLPEDDDRLTITVEDSGSGISAESLACAFDPFFSDKEAGRQPGLGLAVARRLIELHGGTVSIQSTAGEGTQARIVLPGVRSESGGSSSGESQEGSQAA